MTKAPESTQTALTNWQAGNKVGSISMGGMGEPYEQTIQFLVFEIVDEYADERYEEIPDEDEPFDRWGEDVVAEWREKLGGVTGAQIAVARNLAWQYLKRGHEETLSSQDEFDPDRLITVNRRLPDAPDPDEAFKQGWQAAKESQKG